MGALEEDRQMETLKVKPNEITMIGIISSCSQLQDLNLGREFNHYIEEHGLEMTIPLNNALMDMYVKCLGTYWLNGFYLLTWHRRHLFHGLPWFWDYARFGFLDIARELLFKIPEKTVVPWNAIISGCIQAKKCKEALALSEWIYEGLISLTKHLELIGFTTDVPAYEISR